MPEQILVIESSLGYWSVVEDATEITLTVNSGIGNYDSDINKIIAVSKNKYVPQKGDRICFMPGVSIPRVKFRNMSVEHGIKTARNPEDANIFFANASSIHKMTSHIYGYKIKTDDFRAGMADADLTSKVDAQHLERVNTALEFYTNEYIMVDRPLANFMSTTRNWDKIPPSSRLLIVSDSYKKMIDASQGKEIYDESGIVDQLNGDQASIIDAAMYDQLTVMFQSNDKDNHVLAMEIMANCKYNASLVYLLLLFKNQSHRIYESHTKSHVNFKSLTGWIGDNIIHRNSIDSITMILREKGQLTPENLNIILDHCHQDVLDSGDSAMFRVKTVTLDPEYLAEMNVNYSYEIKEDFVPSVQVIEEEVLVGEEEAPESEFAVEDNFEMIEGLEEGQIIEEPVEAMTEEVKVEPLSESELNNHQINTQNESGIDWF